MCSLCAASYPEDRVGGGSVSARRGEARRGEAGAQQTETSESDALIEWLRAVKGLAGPTKERLAAEPSHRHPAVTVLPKRKKITHEHSRNFHVRVGRGLVLSPFSKLYVILFKQAMEIS